MQAGPLDSRGLPDIKSLSREQLAEVLAELGHPRYRTTQVVAWLFARGARGFGEMSDLPAKLRRQLAERFALSFPHIASCQTSSIDGTRKYLLELAGGTRVECVGLPSASGDRLTVCFSTQAGCAMGCSFCATGRGGLVRNLGPGEMVDQLSVAGTDFGKRVSNAVAMGQGEPFANYGATLAALRYMNAKDALGIGARHLTVSTCGILPGIRRFAAEPEQFTLAVSLHSAVQSTRDRLMPAMRSYPLGSLRAALGEYGETGRRPTLEYALIAGVNDSDDELKALVEFCRGLLCHVNLIPVNAVGGTGYDRAGDDVLARFRSRLTAANVEASVRAERGADIDAACGQLAQSHSA